MTLGNDTDIWPLSLYVIKRACWNNYRTCVWRITLAWGHGQLSNGVPALGMALDLTGGKVRGSGAKGQEGEKGMTAWWGKVKSLVGLGVNLVKAGGHGASAPFWSFKKTGRCSEDGRLQINKLPHQLLPTFLLFINCSPVIGRFLLTPHYRFFRLRSGPFL